MIAVLLAVTCTALDQPSENELIEYACELQQNTTILDEFCDEVDRRHESDINGQRCLCICVRKWVLKSVRVWLELKMAVSFDIFYRCLFM